MSQTKIRALHIMDASISTATVDIQVMRIGTKQMTLAVFRQLPERNIFKSSGLLVAPPWGWVNYDRQEYPRAKPFIFSYDGVLYRADVNLGEYSYLRVVAKIECKKLKTGRIVNGYYEFRVEVVHNGWQIVSRWDGRTGPVDGLFPGEENAQYHLDNLRESVSILADAPQLFIGV